MRYYTAKTHIKKIAQFEEDLKGIDIAKADLKRKGGYTKAIEQLKQLKEGDIHLEDIFGNPDNTLRNIMMLSHLDKIDESTKKQKRKM